MYTVHPAKKDNRRRQHKKSKQIKNKYNEMNISRCSYNYMEIEQETGFTTKKKNLKTNVQDTAATHASTTAKQKTKCDIISQRSKIKHQFDTQYADFMHILCMRTHNSIVWNE